MINSWAFGEMNYVQRVYNKLNEEYQLRTIDSTDTNFKAATRTNSELLGTLINIFKDSTQICRPNKSSKNALVNKIVNNEKCVLKDIAGTINITPAIQDSLNTGSVTVGALALTKASTSTSISTISDERIVFPADINERTYVPAVVDERKRTAVVSKERSGTVALVDEKNGIAAVYKGSVIRDIDGRRETLVVDERSRITAADERSRITAADERSRITAADERSRITAADERSRITAADESSGTPAADERGETLVVDEKSEALAVDERSGIAAVYESSGTPAADERGETLVVDERSEAIAVDERSGIADVYESSGTPTADERSGIAAVHESSGTPAADERGETIVVDERNETLVVEESSGTPAVYERSKTPVVDEGCGIPAVVIDERSAVVDDDRSGTAAMVDARTGNQNFIRGNGIPCKSPNKVCKEINQNTPSVIKSINENCPDTKSVYSSQLYPYENFDNQINSEHLSDLEQFIEAINLANSDMIEKSGKLLQKQTLVSEILSYIQATQSVCRLSVLRNIFVDDLSRDEHQIFDFSSTEDFHSAGDYILEELEQYLRYLKADYKDWEFKRITILHISASIPGQFQLCSSEKSSRILMHEIASRICSILQEMNDITSRREERNIEFSDIGEGIDRYIKFSSSFITRR